MFNKIIVLIFCTCLLVMYLSQICYSCTKPIVNGWFTLIFVVCFVLIYVKMYVSYYYYNNMNNDNNNRTTSDLNTILRV